MLSCCFHSACQSTLIDFFHSLLSTHILTFFLISFFTDNLSKTRKSPPRKLMRTNTSTLKKENFVQVKECDKRRSSISSAPSASCKEYIKNVYNRDSLSRGSKIPHFVGHTSHARTKSCDDLSQPTNISWRAPLSAKESQTNVINTPKPYIRTCSAKPSRKNSTDVRINTNCAHNNNNQTNNNSNTLASDSQRSSFSRGRSYYASLPRNRSQPTTVAAIERSDQKYQSGRFSRSKKQMEPSFYS